MRRRIVGNVTSLFLVQAAGYVLPLITFPYILRVIGVEAYGSVVYAMSIVQILLVLTDFSFNYTAAQQIATKRDEPEAVSKIFSLVTTAKFVIMLFCLAGLGLAMLAFPSLREEWPLYLALCPMLLGDVLFPYWLFLGMERVRYVTILTIGSRIITLVLLFVLVHSPDDYVTVGALQAAPYFLAGVGAQWVVWRHFGIRYRLYLRWQEYRPILKDSFDAFLGSLPSQVYGRGAMIILGIYANDRQIGYYAVAQKLASILSSLASPVSQGIFPTVCNLCETDPSQIQKMRRWVIAGTLAVYGVILIPYNAFADIVVGLLNDEVVPEIVDLMRVFSPVLVFSGMNVMLNIFVMAMRRYRWLRRMHIGAAILFLALAFPLTAAWQGTGMAITLAVVEGYITIVSLLITRGNKTQDTMGQEAREE